jgi:hypothetical protein
MAGWRRLLSAWGAALMATAIGSAWLWADRAAAAADAPKGPAKQAAAGPADKLATEEQRVAQRYKHLEDMLLRMAELTAANDPRRAALLKKAVAQSKDQLIAVRLDRLVELLGKDQLSRALENQTEVSQDLRAILELLMSENRAKHIANQRARIREYLRLLNGLITQQKDIQGRTAGGDDAKQLAGQQAKVGEKTGDLAREIRKSEDQKAEEGKPAKGEKPAEGGGKKSEGGPPKSGGQKKDGKQGDQEAASPPQTAREPSAPDRLETARQRMQQAEAKLSQAQRQGVERQQEEAIRQLQLAKAELEKILRQLREEEIGRMLAMLEARFRQMLQLQEEVYEGTVRLDKVPAAERGHNHEIESSRLSGKEAQIVVELDKALLLLRDDGSAVAFLEAAQQMRDDVQQIVERLAAAKVGRLTQTTEEDVLAALKEMIEALKKAQKDLDGKKPPPGMSKAGRPEDPPLVDILAELKMIRALQMRVNTRTARYGKLIGGEQADNGEIIEALKRLGQRQERIYRVTHDLQIGKNQ